MKINYFNYKELLGKYLLVNDLGKYTFLEKDDLMRVISRNIDRDSLLGRNLEEAGMVYYDSDLHFSEELSPYLRNVKSYMAAATSLHIFVVTTACNMNCRYCQANNGSSIPNLFMGEDTAKKAVDIALQSPGGQLSFEFQGGEPLLNFPIIKAIVEHAERQKERHSIEYNLVSNLTKLTEEMLDFFQQYNVSISTSLDGVESVHNYNRPFIGGEGSFKRVLDGIQKVRDRGLHVGAIQTTTKRSLKYAKQMVQTYLDSGFDSIFIRPLTQLGKATKGWDDIGYTAEEFLEFYREAIDEVISINQKGQSFREQHAAIFLKKIFGRRTNYMELRSPCGGGIGQLAYYADGRIFTCDEGRMLAEMGVDAFGLGDVRNDTYQSLMQNRVCHSVCASSTLETIPSCCDCVYQPYCGTCPVVNYAMTGDLIEKYPRSFRCKVYSGILDYLFEMLLKNDCETVEILERWSE